MSLILPGTASTMNVVSMDQSQDSNQMDIDVNAMGNPIGFGQYMGNPSALNHRSINQCNATRGFIPIDKELDDLELAFSDMQMKKHSCSICKEPTDESVTNVCQLGCVHNCHKQCVIDWIIHKGDNAFCIHCSIPYSSSIIQQAKTEYMQMNE